MSKLTKKQLSLLGLIHELKEKQGKSPTVEELRIAGGFNYDRSVTSLLEQLEKAGMLTRLPGKTRNLSLTRRASEALYLPLDIQKWPQRVQSVLERLTTLDPYLGILYQGGKRALEQKSNPLRLQLSAHAMREVIDWLPYVEGKELVKQTDAVVKKRNEGKADHEKVSKRSAALANAFDPYGKFEIGRELNEFFQFFAEFCHGRKSVTENEFLRKVDDFESLLFNCVLLTQPQAYSLLDKAISAGPNKADFQQVSLLTRKNAECKRYFCERVDASWFENLEKAEILSDDIYSLHYLGRIAAEKPREVMDFILGLKPSEFTNPRVYALCVNVAHKMPVKIGREIVKRISKEGWLKENPFVFLEDELLEFLGNLIREKEMTTATQLLDIVFGFHSHERGGSIEARTHIDVHYLEKAERFLAVIPPEELEPFIKILVQKLQQAVDIERRLGDGDYDRSRWWCNSIESPGRDLGIYKSKQLVVELCRDLLVKYFRALGSGEVNLDEKLESILPSSGPKIFLRLKLHICRVFPTSLKGTASSLIRDHIEEFHEMPEYPSLLKEVFPILKSADQKWYLDLVHSEEEDRSQLYKLFPIKPFLPEQEKVHYDDLVKKHGFEPDEESYSHGVRILSGTPAPISQESMSAMSIPTVVEYLRNSNFSDKWDSPLPELARLVQMDVERRPSEWADGIAEVMKDPIHPAYLRNLFYGLEQALRRDTRFSWSKVGELISWICLASKEGRLPTFKPLEPEFEPEAWDSSLFRSIASLLETALNKDIIPKKSASETWQSVYFLTQHPDPSKQEESSVQWELHHLSINCVRGEAFHAAIAYLFWMNRNESKGEPLFPDFIQNFLDEHLDTKIEPSRVIRFLYGYFFPNLYYVAREWLLKNLEIIFPKGDDSLFTAAMEGYLARNVGKDLVPLVDYSRAIDLMLGRKNGHDEIKDRLVSHIALIHFLDLGDPSLGEFMEKSTVEQRATMVNFVGRVMMREDAKDQPPINTSKLVAFWGDCLEEGNEKVLQEFGTWADSTVLDQELILKHLLLTLQKTKGEIQESDTVIELLEQAVEKNAYLCGEILREMTFAKYEFAYQNYYLFMKRSTEAVKKVLLALERSGQEDLFAKKEAIVDRLLKMGFEEYRDLGGDDNLTPLASVRAD